MPPKTVTFNHAGGNTFTLANSTLGMINQDAKHHFTLDVPYLADVKFTLDWDDLTGASDLDFYVTGAASSASDGAASGNPERATLIAARGLLRIVVDPYLILSVGAPLRYTLRAEITTPQPALPKADRDGDDTPDAADLCVDVPGDGADGCPMPAMERILVYIDDAKTPASSEDVDATEGRDDFRFPVWVPKGNHTLRVVWTSTRGKVYATRSVPVTRT
jgi:hypothetical protein